MPPARGSTIVIAGGSGFLGHSLARHLSSVGATVSILSRSAPRGQGSWRYVAWDARTLGDWAHALDNADALVNLVGRSVDCIKTPDHRDEILRSRVEATRVLGEACARVRHPPPVWVQMSTAHIYGDPPGVVCDERSPTGHGLAPDVGRAWEREFESAKPTPARGVVLRTGFVIARPNPGGKGALGKLGLLARLGLGGRVGRGSQGMSWIHEADLNRLVRHAIEDERMRGVYVASAPNPVPQAEFMRELRRVAGGLGALGIAPPTPAWLVRIGAPLVMRTDPELAIYGRYVVSARLPEAGFEFLFPTLRPALADLFSAVAPPLL